MTGRAVVADYPIKHGSTRHHARRCQVENAGTCCDACLPYLCADAARGRPRSTRTSSGSGPPDVRAWQSFSELQGESRCATTP